ncbi:PKD domain-containing protein [Halorubellus sp. JP-L1]|uniref:PKD domain-containing protein n=1 Tax=Halorubellus sp. JP-L1 TaxID=2715753 RepID=UPI00140A83CD|nr:PKD domain-containing protein [Halorubellus sp. JP-L1]NHN42818.1 PKD domain-containing protein [Halorubellus sp. JP-L1]
MAADSGEITIDVVHENGNQAGEVNALVIYQDGQHYETVENYPSVDLEHMFSNLPTGHDYTINAYIHDQLAGSVGPFTLSSDDSWFSDPSSVSKTITVENPVELSPTVTYQDGSTPLEGATVRVKSHQDDPDGSGKVVWRSATTTGDGTTDPSPLYLYPSEGTAPGYYTVEVLYGGEQVASERFDDLDSDASPTITTDATVPEYDVSASTDGSGSVDGVPDGPVEAGSTVTLTADPDAGHEFAGWSGDVPAGADDERVTLTVDADTSVTAEFEELAGDLTVDVRHENGDRASEVNGLIVWQDSVGGEAFRTFENYPSVAVAQKINDLPGGHEYKVTAYVNDQYAGSTDWIAVHDSDESATITVDDPASVEPTVYYADGSTPLSDARVVVESHEGVEWRSSTTTGDGTTEAPNLYLHPTDEGYYDVTVYYDGEQVASERVDSLSGDRSLDLTTSVEGTVDGTITGYRSPSSDQEYALDEWYDVTVAVRNDGSTERTFTVRPKVPSGTETRSERETVTVAPGATETVTFEQRWYGTYTQTRSFSHELLVDTDDDGSKEVVDEGSVTLSEPRNGDLHLAPNTGDGEPASFQVTATNTETGDTEIDRQISTDGTNVSAKIISVPAGTYDVTVDGDGYRSKTTTVTVEADTERVVEPLVTPTGVDATIDDAVDVSSGTYETGDTVEATVDVTNTGENQWEFFVGYSVRHAESGETYSNEGQTGTFVTLEPGETRSVTVEWRVDDGAQSGTYDVVTAVWYGYPEDGADQIESSGWTTGVFDVSDTPTTSLEYQGSKYTIEERSDGTVAVYDDSGSLVGAETAKKVLQYRVFVNNSVDDATGGWWEVTNQSEDFRTYYWLSHANQAGITGFKAYVNSHFGGYKDSIGEFVDLSVQATRALNQQRSGATYQWLNEYSRETQRAYAMYDGQKTEVERLTKTAELVQEAYRLKKTSDDVDTVTDAVRQASDSTDAGETIQGIAIETAMLPLNDVSAGLKTTEKQSLLLYHWGKTSKANLQMLENLEEKRRAGTITPDEMRLYYYLQIRFYSSQTNLWRHMATLQERGERSSVGFDLIASAHGNSPEKFRDSAEGIQMLVELKADAMGRFLNRSDRFVDRSVNVRDDPVKTQLDTAEPLTVQPSSWVAPGEEATIDVSSRGRPVINAKVAIGDKVVETDSEGTATVTFYQSGSYDVTISKDGFESAQAALLVREPNVSTQGFSAVSLGTVSGEESVTRSTEMTNSGEVAVDVTDASIDHDGLSASVASGHADPGETIEVSVTADPTELETGSFTANVTVEWESVDETTEIPVSGTVDDGDEDVSLSADAGGDRTVEAGATVTFDASGSSDPEGDVESYEWTVEGDDASDRSGARVEYAFERPGTYEVTVTVTDGDGNTDDDTVVVTVEERDTTTTTADEGPATDEDPAADEDPATDEASSRGSTTGEDETGGSESDSESTQSSTTGDPGSTSEVDSTTGSSDGDDSLTVPSAEEPGFGIVAALLALLGLLAVGRRR